ncbi:MAG: 16S rRNA (cytidine(1402)-2'-O)-methyltransferase [Ardenticatenaceae bacterium]|nr:16S rRNA (cytidine(1402)-2'-O)-methyltransferase [Ardenticatenaceae bacterium]
MGTLYLVATPIGNLEDMTFRAVRVLKEAGLIAAEDTRTSGRLLQHFGIETPLTSYFEHNKLAKLDRILAALETGDVALISEAGMPGISDPGYELVVAAIRAGYPVVPIPGPSALVTALAASGLPTDSFVYLGFLPRKSGQRRAVLREVADQPRTLVFYEAPHRVAETLADLSAELGEERPVVLARELTKRYEEFWRGTLAEAQAHVAAQEPRGEFVILVGGAPAGQQMWDDERVRQGLRELQAGGITGSKAVKQVARQSGRSRSEVYDLWLGMTGST